MAEHWERAVAAALKGQPQAPRAITLDGAVKCAGGRLPPPSLFEGQLVGLEHLSIANVRLSSLEGFPRLPSLRRLVLSDNRISGGLQALVDAGLDALRDVDLSNNRIATLEELTPLAKLRLESLDLYECPVTKTKGYRSKVFGLIASLKYLDKIDADGNERQDTDDEEDEDEEEEEAGEEDEGEEIDNDGGELEDDEGDEEEGEEEEDDNEEDDDEGDGQVGVEDDNATEIPKRKINGESRNVGDGDQVEPQRNGATLHKSSSSKRKREGANEP